MGYRGMGHISNRGTGGMGYKGMGHISNRSHGQWSTWAMGPMGDLDIFAHNIINMDGFLQKFYST